MLLVIDSTGQFAEKLLPYAEEHQIVFARGPQSISVDSPFLTPDDIIVVPNYEVRDSLVAKGLKNPIYRLSYLRFNPALIGTVGKQPVFGAYIEDPMNIFNPPLEPLESRPAKQQQPKQNQRKPESNKGQGNQRQDRDRRDNRKDNRDRRNENQNQNQNRNDRRQNKPQQERPAKQLQAVPVVPEKKEQVIPREEKLDIHEIKPTVEPEVVTPVKTQDKPAYTLGENEIDFGTEIIYDARVKSIKIVTKGQKGYSKHRIYPDGRVEVYDAKAPVNQVEKHPRHMDPNYESNAVTKPSPAPKQDEVPNFEDIDVPTFADEGPTFTSEDAAPNFVSEAPSFKDESAPEFLTEEEVPNFVIDDETKAPSFVTEEQAPAFVTEDPAPKISEPRPIPPLSAEPAPAFVEEGPTFTSPSFDDLTFE